MSTIVVGYDGSETAELAVQRAAQLAAGLDATVHLVTALKRDKAKRVHAGEHWTIGGLDDAEQHIENLAGTLTGVTTSHSVQFADAAEALLTEADRLDASTIVVGNRRVQGISRVLGSVANEVLRKANCDVYVACTTG